MCVPPLYFISVFIVFISVYTVILSCCSISFNRNDNTSEFLNIFCFIYFHVQRKRQIGRLQLKKALLMECPNIKNRDTLLKYPYVLSIYLIVLYLLSYSEFFVFPQPMSNATTTVTFFARPFSL